MRLLHVIPTYVPAWRHGGPVAATHGLCAALAARGHDVTVFTTDVHGAGTLDVLRAAPVAVDGVTVWYFPTGIPRRLYRSPAMARALAGVGPAPAGPALDEPAPDGPGPIGPAPPEPESNEAAPDAPPRTGPSAAPAARRGLAAFDLVHLHSVFLWPTLAAARAAARARVPYLVAPRGMLVADLLRRRGRLRKRLWVHLVERRTLAHAAAVHATSDLEAAELARLGLELPPIHVVPNGVEDQPPRPGAPLSPAVRDALARSGLVLFLGRVSWKKGLDRLIPALVHAPAATLAIAGNDEEGYLATVERLAARAGVAARVLALGPVHGADKAALLHGAAVLVLPSYSENFGNVVLEAMAAGCPVVATPEVGLAATVAAAGAGVVVAGDPPALGAALDRLLADPAARAAMGSRGREAAARQFSWAAIAGRMEQVYAAILAARRPSSGTTAAAGAVPVRA